MHSPGFIKRIIVMIYDGLLLFSVMAVTSGILMALYMFIAPPSLFVDPNTLENPLIVQFTQTGKIIGSVLVTVNCITLSFVFYAWFWVHGGQTLGMKVWSLYLIEPDGKFINWKTAGIRYITAVCSWLCFGLGFTWILLNKDKRAWHDISSNSRIVRIKKK